MTEKQLLFWNRIVAAEVTVALLPLDTVEPMLVFGMLRAYRHLC